MHYCFYSLISSRFNGVCPTRVNKYLMFFYSCIFNGVCPTRVNKYLMFFYSCIFGFVRACQMHYCFHSGCMISSHILLYHCFHSGCDLISEVWCKVTFFYITAFIRVVTWYQRSDVKSHSFIAHHKHKKLKSINYYRLPKHKVRNDNNCTSNHG